MLEYRTDLFDAATIGRLGEAARDPARRRLADPEVPLAALPLPRRRERHQLLVEWNDTAAPSRTLAAAASRHGLHQRFAGAAGSARRRAAADLRGPELSYGELGAPRQPPGPPAAAAGSGRTCGRDLPRRSPEMVGGAARRAQGGGAYVPLDPDYPAARRRVCWRTPGRGCCSPDETLHLLAAPACRQSAPVTVRLAPETPRRRGAAGRP